ncbi:G protein-coupled receptor 184 [Aplochiton taeniatus]
MEKPTTPSTPATNGTNANATCVNIGESFISDFLMSVYILAFVLGLTFNLLTLGPIWQQVRSRNVLAVFLLNLSLSDLLYILTMPLWINYYHQDHHWKLGPASCSVAGFFYYSNMYISVYLLCCISVDRCLVVTFPMQCKTRRTPRYAWALCLAVCVLVTALHVLVLVFDELGDAHDERNGHDRCYETYPMQPPMALFNVLRVGIGFLLPLLVLGVSYWKVLATVGRSPGLAPQAKRKVRLLSVGVIGIFSVCFAPYNVLLLARSLAFFGDPEHYCAFERAVHFPFSCTLALSSLNCVVDPVLYVLVSNRVRDEMCWWRREGRSRTEQVGPMTNTNLI